MTLGPVATVSARVVPGAVDASPARLGLWVAGTAPTLRLTIDDAVLSAHTAPSRQVGVRVLLDGVDVTADLVGEVTWTEGLDLFTRECSFALAGQQYKPHRTEATWSRSTSVEIHAITAPLGPAGPGPVADVPVLVGTVESCTATATGVQIQGVDAARRWGTGDVCYTAPPVLVGTAPTRGQIVREVAAAKGVPATAVPDGAEYPGPVDVSGPLYDFLQAWGLPEGWHWRASADGTTLEAYTARLRRPPEPADHVWHLRELLAPPAIQPPEAPPSRWVVRGERTIVEDAAAGETVEIETVTISGLYAPKVAVERVGTGGPPGTPQTLQSFPAEQPVSILTTTTTKRGSVVLRQVAEEQGWYNPRAPVLGVGIGGSPGDGPGELGTYHLPHYLDEEGEARLWPQERFGLIGRREIVPSYAAAGTLLGQETKVYAWHAVREAICPTSSLDPDGVPVPTRIGVLISRDGVSYTDLGAQALEVFGLTERQVQTVVYDAKGAQSGETLDLHTWTAPLASLDEDSGFFLNFSGEGMVTPTEQFIRSQRTEKSLLTDESGRLKTELELTYGYAAPPTPRGAHDYGPFKSNLRSEAWTRIGKTSRAITVTGNGQYRVTTVSDGESPTTETFNGQPPTPSWTATAYTQLVTEPLELVVDDDTLRSWFGDEISILQSPYIQTLDEAAVVLRDFAEKSVAHPLTVERPDHPVRPGQTIDLHDPHQRFHRRALAAKVQHRRSLDPPRATCAVELRSPLPLAPLPVGEIP